MTARRAARALRVDDEVRRAVLLAATESNRWTNADLADDLGLELPVVARARSRLVSDGLLERGHNRRLGLVLTDLGRAWCRLEGWRVA